MVRSIINPILKKCKLYRDLPSIREISFVKKDDDFLNFGKFITTTQNEDFICNTGITLYQSSFNPNIGYKIYNDYVDGTDYSYDAILIQKLASKQKNISLIDFPTGIVTLNGRIIGQEIPFYENAINLYNYSINNKQISCKELVIQELKIIKSLVENDIIYIDCNTRNFIWHDDRVKLIDFEPPFVSFSKYNHTSSKTMIHFLEENIKNIFNNYGYNCEIDIKQFMNSNEFLFNDCSAYIQEKSLKKQ